jgi:hypothetical protein
MPARCVVISSDGKREYPLPLLLRLWVRIADESILALAKIDRLSAPYAVQDRIFDVRFPPALAAGHHENSELDLDLGIKEILLEQSLPGN